MTRNEAIDICIHTMPRLEASLRDKLPERLCDRLIMEASEDTVDQLVALGILTLDPELSDTFGPSSSRLEGGSD